MLLLGAFIGSSAVAEGFSAERIILDNLEINEIQELASEVEFDFLSLTERIISGDSGDISVKFSEILGILQNSVAEAFRDASGALILPIAAVLLLKFILPKDALVRKAAFLICRISCMTVFVSVYGQAAGVAESLFDKILRCSETLTPVMIAATALSGAESTAAALTPLSSMASSALQSVLCNWSIAFSGGAAGIAIANGLSDRIQLKQLQKLFRQGMNWVIGFLMTGFMGMLTIQGRIGAGRDTAVSRTVRYTIESVIPIVGGDISNSLDSLLSTAFLVKNAVGAAGLILILAVCLLPLIEILCAVLAFKLVAAIAEPAGDDSLTLLSAEFADATEILLISALASILLCVLLTGSCMQAAANVLR